MKTIRDLAALVLYGTCPEVVAALLRSAADILVEEARKHREMGDIR